MHWTLSYSCSWHDISASMLTTCFWGHLAIFWWHCSSLTLNECPICIQDGWGHWHILISLGNTSQFPNNCAVWWMSKHEPFSVTHWQPNLVCQNHVPMSAKPHDTFDQNIPCRQLLLWLCQRPMFSSSAFYDLSTVARNFPDHSGSSNGFPSILANTILGNFIDSDTGAALQVLDPRVR